ncbi:disease resistance-responsive (dirigent-like protein) family protein [Actinidia rufa]|uniref:Dirigent protein n=1 Tax=Actinidia rufa TaxID=165716 RepID=A0A7J0F2Q8_9ERIC|nr:disease resistance-responsive (dirigent-like protein) family protein [Actinidia rufa]
MASSSSLNFPLFALSLILLSTSLTTTNATFSEEISKAIALKRMEKTTHLHFYFHDILSGKNPTAVKIAGAKDTPVMAFGSTFMIDDPLTEGRELTSKLVWQSPGNVRFRGPKQPPRVSNVVGGSGLFRLARGYALAHTVWFDVKTKDTTVEYNVYLVHY